MRLKGRLSGGRELERKLKRLEALGRREVQQRALMAGGEPIAEGARRRVRRRSGQTAASITVSDRARGVSAGGRPMAFVGPAWPEGFRGWWIEAGTIDTPAWPFMRTALEAHAGEALERIAASLKVELRRATGG